MKERQVKRYVIIGLAISVLLISGAIGAWLIRSEIRAGGMSPKWVYHAEARDAPHYDVPLFVDHGGSLIVSQPGSIANEILSISPNGTFEWKFSLNAGASLIEGPDDGFYYVDWPDSSVWALNNSLAGFRNLTVHNSDGGLRWSYVAENGTLEIWGIFPDGFVIALRVVDLYNSTSQSWYPVKDEIVGLNNGLVQWSMDMPINTSIWGNPGVDYNGTFVVHAYNYSDQARYEVGISKSGEVLYMVKGNFFLGTQWPPSVRDGVMYEVRREYVDNETNVVNAYAISLTNGSTLWKTKLRMTDNSDRLIPGSWEPSGALVDGNGIIYSPLQGLGSYGLDTSGNILWEKPFLGWMLSGYSAEGFLLWDNVSLKKIDENGSLVWRHYVTLDGYSSVVLGADGTVYYGLGTTITALAKSTGTSANLAFFLLLVGVDAVVVVLTIRILRPWKRQEST